MIKVDVQVQWSQEVLVGSPRTDNRSGLMVEDKMRERPTKRRHPECFQLYVQATVLYTNLFYFWLVGYGRVTGDSAVTRPRVPEEAFSGSCLLQLDPLQMRGYEQLL